MDYHYDIRAVRFQRVFIGLLLLLAFVTENLNIALLPLILMVLFLVLPPQFSPVYRLFFLFSKTAPLCTKCSDEEIRFSCLLGTILIFTGLLLYWVGAKGNALVVIFLVAFLSIVAGVSDFCLGRLLYVWIKRRFRGT